MKKTLLLIAAIVCMAFGAAAQATLHLGYGGYTQMDATDMHGGGATNNAWGALTAGVYFKTLPKLQLGASYTFSSTDFKHSDHTNLYYHVIMLNGKYDYYRSSLVNVYMHAGVGADITHISVGDYTRNRGYFAYQISPLGAEAEVSRGVKLFGELGFGAQGLLQVGLKIGL